MKRIFGVSCWGLRSSSYTGRSYLSDYEYVLEHAKIDINAWRNGAITKLSGVDKNGNLETWKKDELKWMNKFFKDNDIAWHLTLGWFNSKPECFFDKRLDRAVTQLLKIVDCHSLEMGNEIEYMFDKRCLGAKKVIKRHNELVKLVHSINPEQKITVSPYYHGHIYPDPRLYELFEPKDDRKICDRHVYRYYTDRYKDLPKFIPQLGEINYALYQKYKDMFKHCDKVLFWFDKRHHIPGITFGDYTPYKLEPKRM